MENTIFKKFEAESSVATLLTSGSSLYYGGDSTKGVTKNRVFQWESPGIIDRIFPDYHNSWIRSIVEWKGFICSASFGGTIYVWDKEHKISQYLEDL